MIVQAQHFPKDADDFELPFSDKNGGQAVAKLKPAPLMRIV